MRSKLSDDEIRRLIARLHALSASRALNAMTANALEELLYLRSLPAVVLPEEERG